MPLRCISSDGDELSFEHDAASWADLRERNSRDRHLRFMCCDAGVVLKMSSLGTRYFAHKARGGCDTAPETQEHLRAKLLERVDRILQEQLDRSKEILLRHRKACLILTDQLTSRRELPGQEVLNALDEDKPRRSA